MIALFTAMGRLVWPALSEQWMQFTEQLPKLIEKYNKQHPSKPLRRIRLHDLRHIHATTLLLAGVPVHMVAARLGHADPSVTVGVFAHVSSS